MKLRLVTMLLLLSVLLGCFTGCGGTPEETTTPNENGGEEQTPIEKKDQLVIAENGECKYRIVYPIKSSNTTVQAEAEALATLIEDVTGAKPTVTHDSNKETEY